jgi:hypothetical protein
VIQQAGIEQDQQGVVVMIATVVVRWTISRHRPIDRSIDLDDATKTIGFWDKVVWQQPTPRVVDLENIVFCTWIK